ncbi:MAG: hypothetical protein LBB56_04230 [Chitinispirillales bacterium]|jgi:hypothetical protein|nr:hypothetical protein [Chitinispirillales bacterium]
MKHFWGTMAVSLFLMTLMANAQTPNTGWYTANPGAASFNISTADQLAGLAQLVNNGNDFSGKTITLKNSINLHNYKNWAPIGNGSAVFSGVFNGRGFVVNNLSIDRDASEQGLFGYVHKGQIENLGVVNANIKGRGAVGIIAGRIFHSSVVNCYSSGMVTGNANDVGGLLGHAGSSVFVTKCRSYVTVSGAAYVGGLVGGIDYGGVISECYSTGTVTGTGWNVGGIVSHISRSRLTKSYSSAAVTGTTLVGGLVADVLQNGVLEYCTALNPAVKGENRVGRVAGNLSVSTGGVLSNNTAYSKMKNSAGNANWINKGADNLDGADVSIAPTDAEWTMGRGSKSASAHFVSAAGGTLHFRFSDRGKVDIYTLNGAKLRSLDFAQGDHSHRLNDLPLGMYIVNAVSGSRNHSLRVAVK